MMILSSASGGGGPAPVAGKGSKKRKGKSGGAPPLLPAPVSKPNLIQQTTLIRTKQLEGDSELRKLREKAEKIAGPNWGRSFQEWMAAQHMDPMTLTFLPLDQLRGIMRSYVKDEEHETKRERAIGQRRDRLPLKEEPKAEPATPPKLLFTSGSPHSVEKLKEEKAKLDQRLESLRKRAAEQGVQAATPPPSTPPPGIMYTREEVERLRHRSAQLREQYQQMGTPALHPVSPESPGGGDVSVNIGKRDFNV